MLYIMNIDKRECQDVYKFYILTLLSFDISH